MPSAIPSHQEIAQTFLDAQKTRDAEKIKQVGQWMSDDVKLISMRGNLEGRDAVLERLGNPGQAAMLLDRVQWGELESQEGGLKVKAELPAGLPIPIQEFSASFSFGEDDRLERIEFVLQR